MKIDPKDYESQILKADDFKGQSLSVNIEKVEQVTLPQTGKTYMVTFREFEKVLALNRTNLKTLIELFGDETDSWVKKPVILYKVLVNNPQTKKEVEGLRLKEYTGIRSPKKK